MKPYLLNRAILESAPRWLIMGGLPLAGSARARNPGGPGHASGATVAFVNPSRPSTRDEKAPARMGGVVERGTLISRVRWGRAVG